MFFVNYCKFTEQNGGRKWVKVKTTTAQPSFWHWVVIDQTRNVGCSRLQYQLLIRDTQKVFAVALAKHVIALFRLHRRAGLRNSQMGNFSTGKDIFDAGQRCVLSSPGFFNGAPFSYRNRTSHLYEIIMLRFIKWLLRAYKYRQLRPWLARNGPETFRHL